MHYQVFYNILTASAHPFGIASKEEIGSGRVVELMIGLSYED
jgi:hypothetical protein